MKLNELYAKVTLLIALGYGDLPVECMEDDTYIAGEVNNIYLFVPTDDYGSAEATIRIGPACL